jgi:hypothetical protein
MEKWRMAEPWVRRKAEELHEAASTNMPIDLEAEHLLTSADKKFGPFVTHEQLRGWLDQPDWWQFVVTFHPALQPYHAWMDDLRRELLALLSEEEGRPASGPSEERE